jgi:hypothetical protein
MGHDDGFNDSQPIDIGESRLLAAEVEPGSHSVVAEMAEQFQGRGRRLPESGDLVLEPSDDDYGVRLRPHRRTWPGDAQT